jgi:hypothetical protein
MAPVGDNRYLEFHKPELTLAISSKRMIDRHGAGATTPRANCSVILVLEAMKGRNRFARQRSDSSVIRRCGWSGQSKSRIWWIDVERKMADANHETRRSSNYSPDAIGRRRNGH